jgi:putative ABC transport system permease protein
VQKVVEGRGHPVTRVDVPTPGKHPHADIMGLLLLALASFGLFVMILSGIIVINLLTALMAAQIRQIGMMKAIGATRGQVARIYFGQALLLGCAAIVIALPAGILGSRALCRAMAVFLNFDITSFAIPAWVYLLAIAVGILVPLLAAAGPVWKGSGISVRRALADYGVAGDAFGAGRIDRMLAGTGGLARPLLLSIRNNFRRRTRLLLTIATLAAGGLFFMTALNLRASMIETLDRLFATKKYDLAVNIAGMAQAGDVDRVVRTIPGIRKAEGWIASEASLGEGGAAAAATHGPAAGGMHGGGGAIAADRFIVFALPARTALFEPDVVQGRWLRDGETDTMVINSALAAKSPRLKVGSRASLLMGPGAVSLRIAGIVREPFSPPVAYMPRAYFDAIEGHRGITNNVRIVLDRTGSASIDRVKTQLDDRLGRAGIRATSITSKADTRFGFDQHMVMIYVALILMSTLIGGVGGLGLMTTMSLNVLERRREMGVLRAIGASPRIISWMLVLEGAVAGLLSWILATAAAWPLSKVLGDLLVTKMFKSGLDFRFEPGGAAIWLAVSLLLGAVASALPAWHAARRPIREALGYE